MLLNKKVNKKMKSFVATNTMKTMISNIANGDEKKFNKEMIKFAKSKMFDWLFNFETGVWREGPDFLMNKL